jgi:hypothetical protein
MVARSSHKFGTRLAGYRYSLAKGIFDLNGAAPASGGSWPVEKPRKTAGSSFMSRSIVAEIGHDNVRFLSL